MTESDWLTATDPQEMPRACGTPSDRKLRLFAVACCRRIWHLLTDKRSERAVEAAEVFSDSPAEEELRRMAERSARSICSDQDHPHFHAADAALAAVRSAVDATDVADAVASDAALTATGDVGTDADFDQSYVSTMTGLAQLLRDIVANPFASPPRIEPASLAWNDGTIPKLAEAVYQERALPSGELDRDRLAVLADALEEVEADALLLDHLRGPGPHVRGCWLIDLLTGREASP